MSTLDLQQLVKRIDTVLDILVAKDYTSAINNLEILKADILQSCQAKQALKIEPKKAPWEI